LKNGPPDSTHCSQRLNAQSQTFKLRSWRSNDHSPTVTHRARRANVRPQTLNARSLTSNVDSPTLKHRAQRLNVRSQTLNARSLTSSLDSPTLKHRARRANVRPQTLNVRSLSSTHRALSLMRGCLRLTDFSRMHIAPFHSFTRSEWRGRVGLFKAGTPDRRRSSRAARQASFLRGETEDDRAGDEGSRATMI
jgi:hypothetical protein